MGQWVTKYEDPDSKVEIQVWAEDGGWKATHSVSLGGHSMDGNPDYHRRKVHPTKPEAIHSAVKKASNTILGDHVFSGNPGLRTWAEEHQPQPAGQTELF